MFEGEMRLVTILTLRSAEIGAEPPAPPLAWCCLGLSIDFPESLYSSLRPQRETSASISFLVLNFSVLSNSLSVFPLLWFEVERLLFVKIGNEGGVLV